jgi:hypothetical protein
MREIDLKHLLQSFFHPLDRQTASTQSNSSECPIIFQFKLFSNKFVNVTKNASTNGNKKKQRSG